MSEIVGWGEGILEDGSYVRAANKTSPLTEFTSTCCTNEEQSGPKPWNSRKKTSPVYLATWHDAPPRGRKCQPQVGLR
jgi:hypothetical protein